MAPIPFSPVGHRSGRVSNRLFVSRVQICSDSARAVTCAEGAKVFARLRTEVAEELEDDAANGVSIELDVEEASRSLRSHDDALRLGLGHLGH